MVALCGFAELIDHAQRWRPTKGIVIGNDGSEQDIDLDAFLPRYREVRRRMRRVLGGIEPTRPGSKSECGLCRWRVHCHDQLVATDDLTLLSTVGESERARLSDAGVASREELAAATPDALEAAGFGKRRAATLVRAARVQKSGTPEVIAVWARPNVELEIAYDIEDDVFEPYAYLHGLLLRPLGRNASYEPICAAPPETERDLWSRLVNRVERLTTHNSFCVYVYGSHERTTLRRLAARYGRGDVIEAFIARFVDVHDALTKTVVLPTESVSLKAVATWLGFTWRDATPSGTESMAWWAEYARSPSSNRSALDRILAYNEDDLIATFAVVDWMSRLAL
jgi:uncharacterized protein